MERLGRDVLAVLDALGIRRSTGAACRWAAWSANGSAPMRPDRIEKLILSNTACYFPTRRSGTAASRWCARRVWPRSSTPIWSAGSPRISASARRKRSSACATCSLATNVEGYIGCGEAVRDMDHRPLLAKITAPTLVIAGRHDPATPLEGNEFIAQHIPAPRSPCSTPRISPTSSSRNFTPYGAGVFAWQIALAR